MSPRRESAIVVCGLRFSSVLGWLHRRWSVVAGLKVGLRKEVTDFYDLETQHQTMAMHK